jgi:hypothetical protein
VQNAPPLENSWQGVYYTGVWVYRAPTTHALGGLYFCIVEILLAGFTVYMYSTRVCPHALSNCIGLNAYTKD